MAAMIFGIVLLAIVVGNVQSDDICATATAQWYHLSHPTDSTKFYKCDLNTGVATEFDCPTPLYFNPTIQVCDWPEDSGGTGGSSPAPSPSSNSPSEDPTTPSDDDSTTDTESEAGSEADEASTEVPSEGICATATAHRYHLPHPNDCTKFYKCDLNAGVATEFDCPTPFYFNPTIQVCDWPEDSGCIAGSSTAPTSIPSSENTSTISDDSATEITTTDDEIVTESSTSAPDDDSETTGQTTPSDDDSTTDSESEAGSEADVGSPEVPSDDVCATATAHRYHLPHPTDCTKFYKCNLNTGVATELDCPTPLYFNPTIQVCDWPENSGCTPISG